jgi:CRP/FNR family transcriptional regulator
MAEVLEPAAKNETPKGAVILQRTPGERFYSPLRPPSSLYVLLEGRVSVTRLTSEGKRLVTEVLEAGDVFGDLSFSGAGDDNESAEALTDSRAMVVDSRDAKQLIESDPEVALRLLKAVASRLNVARDRLEEFAYSSAENRVASALLLLAGKAGRTVPVSHQVLADTAGTYRDTATRVLGELQLKDVLQLGRRAIEIKKPQHLVAMAGG